MKSPGHRSGATFSRDDALAAVGLSVAYQRGEGSRLWYTDGHERQVWDFLGGYGSALFGHNHPALTETVVDFLRNGGVVHGQASVREATRALGAALSDRIARGSGGTYEVVFANTGAEIVEAAARHAELVLARRGAAVLETQRVHPAGPTAERGPVRWRRAALEVLEELGIGADGPVLETLAEHNRRAIALAPVHLAVEGAYHGMTRRARTLTHSQGRSGSPGTEVDVMWVDRLDPRGVEDVVNRLAVDLFRIVPGSRSLGLRRERWIPIASFFMEPVQGEGGVRPIAADVARAWSTSCARHGIPLVADEIQSGMGRTGTFLYCEQLGVRPDYVLLGKSLGGGLVKVSAMAVREELCLPDFTLRHASTFAEDDLSSSVALRALELLEEEGALAKATRKGESLLASLHTLAERYPDVIREVRGTGLMMGIELADRPLDRSMALDLFREHGWLGYVAAGFLLRAHGLRVAPTLGSGRTIRLEPAYDVPPEAVARLLEGLEDLCTAIRHQDMERLLGPCLGLIPEGPRWSVAASGGAQRVGEPPAHDERQAHAPGTERIARTPLDGAAHVGFVGHFIDPGDLTLWDPGLARLGPAAGATFLERVRPMVEPVLVHRDYVASVTGNQATLTFIGLAVCSERFSTALRSPERHELRALVQRAVDSAIDAGCSVVGLGGYCSIITRNGRDLDARGCALTTGNGYTVAAGLEAMRASADEMGLEWSHATAAVVGATGNIGSVLAFLLAREVGSLVLLGRPSRLPDLESLAGRILWSVAGCATAGHLDADIPPMARALRDRGACTTGAPTNGGAARFFRACRDALGAACPVRIGSDAALCADATLIAAASNDAGPVLWPRHVGAGPVVINDLSVPPDVHPSVVAERPLARVIRGGVVRLPANPDWVVPGIPLAPGEMYACMAETALMGLEGHRTHGSYGALTPERVVESLEMAGRHGFSSVRAAAEASY